MKVLSWLFSKSVPPLKKERSNLKPFFESFQASPTVFFKGLLRLSLASMLLLLHARVSVVSKLSEAERKEETRARVFWARALAPRHACKPVRVAGSAQPRRCRALLAATNKTEKSSTRPEVQLTREVQAKLDFFWNLSRQVCNVIFFKG